jgi:hypothetical protein
MRSSWRPVIISANAVTWPAVAFSCALRALTRLSWAVPLAGDVVGVAARTG